MIKEWVVGSDESTVLDTEDNWTLEKLGLYSDIEGRINEARYVSLIKHTCTPKHERVDGGNYSTLYQVVCYPVDTDKCWRCYEPIPDKLVVVWRFMNWDVIEHRRGKR
jgi:hypothetical protein